MSQTEEVDRRGNKTFPTQPKRLHEGLDTGDLVLFDRPCLKMGGFFGAAICAAAKVVGGSPFDHVGVVVRSLGKRISDDGCL